MPPLARVWGPKGRTVNGMYKTTFIAAIIAFSVIVVSFVEWGAKRRVRRHLAGRPARSDEQFDRELFPEHGDVASRFRRLLGKYLRLDLAGLRARGSAVRRFAD